MAAQGRGLVLVYLVWVYVYVQGRALSGLAEAGVARDL